MSVVVVVVVVVVVIVVVVVVVVAVFKGSERAAVFAWYSGCCSKRPDSRGRLVCGPLLLLLLLLLV